MDPEGARLLLTLLYYAYGKPRLPPVHKYSSLHSIAHRAAEVDAALHALHQQKAYISEVMSSFKSIT